MASLRHPTLLLSQTNRYLEKQAKQQPRGGKKGKQKQQQHSDDDEKEEEEEEEDAGQDEGAGEEPPAPAPAPAPLVPEASEEAVLTVAQMKNRITYIYEEKNPDKVGDVPSVSNTRVILHPWLCGRFPRAL